MSKLESSEVIGMIDVNTVVLVYGGMRCMQSGIKVQGVDND